MATNLNSTTGPKCTRATNALDALARVRSLGSGAFLALDRANDERMGLAVGAIIHAMLSELIAAEQALDQCRHLSADTLSR